MSFITSQNGCVQARYYLALVENVIIVKIPVCNMKVNANVCSAWHRIGLIEAKMLENHPSIGPR
jgi:hypothetical protein